MKLLFLYLQFYGPRIGAVYVEGLGKTTPLYPVLYGGGQEKNYRPGYVCRYICFKSKDADGFITRTTVISLCNEGNGNQMFILVGFYLLHKL